MFGLWAAATLAVVGRLLIRAAVGIPVGTFLLALLAHNAFLAVAFLVISVQIVSRALEIDDAVRVPLEVNRAV